MPGHLSADEMDDLSYVDTERETVTAEISVNGSAGQNQMETVNDIEVLQEDGGLDRNEVAELHAVKTTAMPTFERTGNETNEPTVQYEFEGVTYFGANLDINEQPRPLAQGPDVQPNDGITTGQPNGATALFSANEVGIFDYVRYFGSRGFFSTADGYGGGPVVTVAGDNRKCWPVDLGIRGPVLDENDDLSYLSRIVVENRNNTDAADFEVVVTTDLVYRIHQIQGVRNDFSLPD